MPRTTPENGGSWGIMGGLFDPIHNGHLTLAEQARAAYRLDGVLFVVSYRPPHRQNKPIASFEDRLQMTEIAVRTNDGFLVSELEKDINGPGYTLSIVELLKGKYPGVTWHLILGADNIEMFESWHKPEKLIAEVYIAVGGRPGYKSELNNSLWNKKIKHFEMTRMEVSSTLIRNRIGEALSIRYLLPDDVLMYIEKKGLYR